MLGIMCSQIHNYHSLLTNYIACSSANDKFSYNQANNKFPHIQIKSNDQFYCIQILWKLLICRNRKQLPTLHLHFLIN